jgi:arylsulfatase A-like enzyme/Flp pilus assembly protein TadD
LAGCGAAPSPTNLVILSLDTTRADRFGSYGYSSAHTPNFDRFSAGSVRFENAITAAPITLPAHTSIMTGTYPVFHGVHDNDGYVLDDGITTLAEILASEGFVTGAVLAAFPLDSQFNLDQGFASYDDDFQSDWTTAENRARTPLSFGFLERKSDRVNMAVERWLDTNASEQFFLWVHYFDPHQPYNAPPPYDTQFSESPYDAEMAFMDENFGHLMEMLSSRGLMENTIIVVVGDHGEGLGQHGEPTHASYLYDTTMRVPLWIAVPDDEFAAGSAVMSQVRTIDIAPTVLDALGLAAGPEMQGNSLVPLLYNPNHQWNRDALLEANFSWYHYGWAPLRALRSDRWKYVLGPQPELYDVSDDPEEMVNLIERLPEEAAVLNQRLNALVEATAARDLGRSAATVVDADTRLKLEALGYLGGGGDASIRVAPFPGPDELADMVNPMDQWLVMTFANFASEMARMQRIDEAISIAREGLAMDPGNHRLRMVLARVYAMRGLIDRSFEELQAARALQPDDPESYVLAGHIRMAQREFQQAQDEFRQAVERAPQVSAHVFNLGLAYARTGDFEEAISHFQAALELDPNSDNAIQELAKSYSQVGRYEEARESFQRALELNPYSPSVLYNIAVFYRYLGEDDFSRRMFQATLQVAPGHVAAACQLAELLHADGAHPEEVQSLAERTIELAPDSPWAERAQKLLDSQP